MAVSCPPIGQNRFYQHAPVIERSHRAAVARTMREVCTRSSSVPGIFCHAHEEAQIRAFLVQGLGASDLHLRELESADIEGADRVAVNACSPRKSEIALEYIVGRLSLEPSVTAARWRAVNTIV